MKKNKIISIFLLSAACLSVSSTPYFSSVTAFDGQAVGNSSTDEKSASVIRQAEELVLSNNIEGMKALLDGEVKEIEADTGYVPSEELINAVQTMLARIAAAGGNTEESNELTFDTGDVEEESDEEANPFGE
ncbi:MAG TPA: hypothetical protein DIC42_06085 [Holosporales bacterium]|nr:hypothetical protein [Holosporales bacterium]